MPVRRSTLIRPLAIAAVVVASSLYAIAQQPPAPSRVRGTIEAVDGDVIAVKSRSGEDFKLHIASDMRLVGIARISLSDIKVGSFIGTTTVPGPDGEVQVEAEGQSRQAAEQEAAGLALQRLGPSGLDGHNIS